MGNIGLYIMIGVVVVMSFVLAFQILRYRNPHEGLDRIPFWANLLATVVYFFGMFIFLPTAKPYYDESSPIVGYFLASVFFGCISLIILGTMFVLIFQALGVCEKDTKTDDAG